jgi:aldehyde dehydrogenase (NAD+)
VNKFQAIFDKQKDYFNTDATKSYEWRIEQLDRMAKMLSENKDAFQEAVSKDFKTALQEKVFEVAAPLATIEFTKMQLKEWMKPVSAMVPKALAASGHTAHVIREPYGVTLIIGPFNGPLILLLDPAITALSAGNPCILKLAESIPATSTLLQKLIPKYFEPESVTAVSGSREEVTELLKLPFDFIFFTGSVRVGKVIMRAAAENLTPVLLELGGQNPAFVDATANLSDAAKKIVWGATAWGGNGVCGRQTSPVPYTNVPGHGRHEHLDCLMLDGWRRWDWQDDFRGDLPVLPDLDPVDDHQKWPGRSVLPRKGDRDIDRRIGFRKVMSQADNLELRKVRL